MIAWRVLVAVEFRKATDTRAARWLLGIVVALGLGLAVFSRNEATSFAESLSAPVLPLALLLPIIAVLAATSDWSQRAALTTFTLIPKRLRILSARLCATVLLVLAIAMVVATLGAMSSLVFHPGAAAKADWIAVGRSLWGITALAVSATLSGTAIGSLLLNTPASIAVTLLVPVTYDIVLGFNAPDVAPWISSLAFATWLARPNWTWATSPDGIPGLGQAASSLVIWVVLPLVAGWWRQLRREVR